MQPDEIRRSLEAIEADWDRQYRRRMARARIRLLLWVPLMAALFYFFPDRAWVKWLLLIPGISILAMGWMHWKMKRMLHERKKLDS